MSSSSCFLTMVVDVVAGPTGTVGDETRSSSSCSRATAAVIGVRDLCGAGGLLTDGAGSVDVTGLTEGEGVCGGSGRNEVVGEGS